MKSWLQSIALCLVICLLWLWANDRTTAKAWRVPITYQSDGLQMLSWFKAASQFDFIPFASHINHRLNAPRFADWDDFPMYEQVLIFAFGMVARVTDVAVASNLAVLFAAVASGLGFFLCAKWIGARPEWAGLGALLFAFSPYATYRGLGHVMLALDYAVPMALVCVWQVASGKVRFWFCAATALVLGEGNPYNLNMWAQLMVLTLLVNRKTWKAVLALLCIAAVPFLAANAHTILYHLHNGPNPLAVERKYHMLELYGLKPIDLVLPPANHRWFPKLAQFYWPECWVKGELFSPYLGLVGIAALVWMLVEFGIRIYRRQQVSSYAPISLWVLAYSVIGGFNCMAGLAFGILFFRSSNRYSIWILGIVLLFAVTRMSRLAAKWPSAASCALAAGLAIFGVLDQSSDKPHRCEWWTRYFSTEDLGGLVDNDQRFARALEQRLPKAAMVFEVPPMNYIDALPIGGMESYEHDRPYLWSKSLRFSFGAIQGRAREDWQKRVIAQPLRQCVKDLERYGFSGLLINRKAYPDGAVGIVSELNRLGYERVVEDNAHELICFVLDPWVTPDVPL